MFNFTKKNNSEAEQKFRTLTSAEEVEFRKWTRKHCATDVPLDWVKYKSRQYHPVVIDEWTTMLREALSAAPYGRVEK